MLTPAELANEQALRSNRNPHTVADFASELDIRIDELTKAMAIEMEDAGATMAYGRLARRRELYKKARGNMT